MEQVAVAAMDEQAQNAVRNAINQAAKQGITVSTVVPEIFQSGANVKDIIAKYKNQLSSDSEQRTTQEQVNDLNSLIDNYNSAMLEYARSIDQQTMHPIQKDRAYKELSSLDAEIGSKAQEYGLTVIHDGDPQDIGDSWGAKTFYKKKIAYATGGLVDFTGPAWVDGSPTSPEAFLSAEDTARIGAAAQLLSNLPFLNTSSITDNSYSSNVGDTTIEVHINIENVSSEQDIDDMINRVRDDIVSMSNQIGNPVLLNK